jgi:hypothetical protein
MQICTSSLQSGQFISEGVILLYDLNISSKSMNAQVPLDNKISFGEFP